MKPLSEMPTNQQAAHLQQTQQAGSQSAKLLFISKVGQLDIQCKSTVYREIFAGRGKTDVISVINVIDLDDNSKHKLVCTTFLERELLKYGKGIVDRRLRIRNLGKEPGKNWYRIEVSEYTAQPVSQSQSVSNQITDDDIPF